MDGKTWWRLTLPSCLTTLFSMLPHDILLVSHPTARKNQFRIDSIWRGHFGWHDQSVLPKELHLCKINIKFYRYFLTTLKWPVKVILGSPAPSKNTNSALQVLAGYCWVGWLWVFPKGIIFFQRWQLQMSLLKSAHFSGKLMTTACGNSSYR